jgi:hypothetical protein
VNAPAERDRDVPWRKLLASLPDFAMAALFVAVWVAPTAFPRDQLRGLALVMLLEFLMMHASVLLGAVLNDLAKGESKRTALLMFGALALCYLAFVAFLAAGFGSWWPWVAFAWLAASKLAGWWFSPARRADEAGRQNTIWIVSLLVLMFAFFPTALLPWPAAGLTPEVVATLEVAGFGAWVDAPQSLCLYGFVYFVACGIMRINVHKGFGA